MKKILDMFHVELEGEVFNLKNREQRIEYGQKKWNRMIRKEASKYKNPVCSYEDFVQEAILMIINAADKWVPTRGKFDTFVYECIKNRLMDVSTRSKYAMSIPSGSIHLSGPEQKTIRIREDEIPDTRFNAFENIDICDTIERFDHFRIGKMYFVESFTMKEISESTGISLSKIHRVINDMRRLLKSRLRV